MDPDTLTVQKIQTRLKSNIFELIKNEKANHEIWQNDISLIRKK